MDEKPLSRTASYAVLHEGYGSPGVAATVGLIRDGDVVVVTDPGMVRDRALILDPLRRAGWAPEDVTDVVFSHHHPDHTLNAALFPNARFHDHWAIYQGDRWDDREAEGYELTPSIRLIRTPGHTREDITTLAGTPAGVVAFTHAWNRATSTGDAVAVDLSALSAARQRVLSLADIVVPGHGPAFVPDAGHAPLSGLSRSRPRPRSRRRPRRRPAVDLGLIAANCPMCLAISPRSAGSRASFRASRSMRWGRGRPARRGTRGRRAPARRRLRTPGTAPAGTRRSCITAAHGTSNATRLAPHSVEVTSSSARSTSARWSKNRVASSRAALDPLEPVDRDVEGHVRIEHGDQRATSRRSRRPPPNGASRSSRCYGVRHEWRVSPAVPTPVNKPYRDRAVSRHCSDWNGQKAAIPTAAAQVTRRMVGIAMLSRPWPGLCF